ncbi:MAG: DUF5689 domain-containing protein [Prevotella pectinovora]|uniref:DUF5689 domain-containing protein n=1 Tax=Prevotella sp. CAG:592 TaxID=1262931 RepID=UPI00033B0AD6|nr:DUF5689 domain-containing protein [Prevotella sp. CAG:592]CDD04393.1 putative uncharacterized protein [Prevotella sp. CAG:592]
MKKTKYIKFLVAAMLLGGLATSCMDDDWNDPTGEVAPYGNNDIVEDDAKMISIKELKAKTVDLIPSSQANDTVRITEDWQLKVRVTGNDIQGNIYNQIAVQDESGEGLLICIQKGGLFGFLPVGQEILVNLKGLYIGIYGNNVQIGVPYTNTSGRTFPSRMNINVWNEHFKILGAADASKVVPEKFDVSKLKDVAYVKSHRGKLMTLENVEMDGADGKLAWAPEADKDAGNGVSRTVKINGKAQSLMVVRSSTYADFAAKAMPTGKVNLTGIFTVYATNPSKYGYTWQILLRSDSDIEEVK